MDNKKYLDKVIGSLVRGTKIDYENVRISPSFFPLPSSNFLPISPSFSNISSVIPFSEYCRNQFGLTKDEIEYVWKEYVEIINDKIKDGK